MNTLVYADITEEQTSSASSIASTMQQMSISFGVATASLVTAFSFPIAFIPAPPEMIHGIHQAFFVLGGITVLSTIVFRRIEKHGWRQHQPAQGPGARRLRINSRQLCGLRRARKFDHRHDFVRLRRGAGFRAQPAAVPFGRVCQCRFVQRGIGRRQHLQIQELPVGRLHAMQHDDLHRGGLRGDIGRQDR